MSCICFFTCSLNYLHIIIICTDPPFSPKHQQPTWCQQSYSLPTFCTIENTKKMSRGGESHSSVCTQTEACVKVANAVVWKLHQHAGERNIVLQNESMRGGRNVHVMVYLPIRYRMMDVKKKWRGGREKWVYSIIHQCVCVGVRQTKIIYTVCVYVCLCMLLCVSFCRPSPALPEYNEAATQLTCPAASERSTAGEPHSLLWHMHTDERTHAHAHAIMHDFLN